MKQAELEHFLYHSSLKKKKSANPENVYITITDQLKLNHRHLSPQLQAKTLQFIIMLFSLSKQLYILKELQSKYLCEITLQITP